MYLESPVQYLGTSHVHISCRTLFSLGVPLNVFARSPIMCFDLGALGKIHDSPCPINPQGHEKCRRLRAPKGLGFRPIMENFNFHYSGAPYCWGGGTLKRVRHYALHPAWIPHAIAGRFPRYPSSTLLPFLFGGPLIETEQ